MTDAVRDVNVIPYEPNPARSAGRIYYGWVCVAAGALAMVATLPGRTMGLGVVTEPLLRDLRLDRSLYGTINLWATILGAGFGLACGRAIDRFGARAVLAGVSLALGVVVLGTSRVTGPWGLFLTVALTRGFGQSALSTASIAVVGKWFERRVDLAMAVYAVLLTVGFMIAMPALEFASKAHGWRAAWAGMGWILVVGATPLLWLMARDSPESAGVPIDGGAPSVEAPAMAFTGPPDLTLGRAVATPAFWAFALAGLLFNAIYSGITLFNESVLAERGFTRSPTGPLVVMVFTGLAANFLGGWLGRRWSISKLMAVAMAILAASVFSLPSIHRAWQVMLYAAGMGLSAGVVTVVFFSCWGKTFGRLHLGKIQGAAQTLTVLASAAGPLALARCHAWTGSYSLAFVAAAPLALALAAFCWFVPMPAGRARPFDGEVAS